MLCYLKSERYYFHQNDELFITTLVIKDKHYVSIYCNAVRELHSRKNRSLDQKLLRDHSLLQKIV